LISLSESYEAVWSQYKQTNNTFVVDLYKNSTAFTLVVLVFFGASLIALLVKWLITRFSVKKKISHLSNEDKTFLYWLKGDSGGSVGFSAEVVSEKIESLKQNGLLHEKFSINNNDVYVSWLPY